MTDPWERALAAGLTVAALVLAAVLAHREFKSERQPVALETGPPTYVRDWQRLMVSGLTLGNDGAPVTIVEFADLECPICRRFDASLRAVQVRYPGQVRVVFVHFPLSQHRFARPAARAAKCASLGGAFAGFVKVVFEKQDSLGLKSWGSYAREAGLGDSLQFAQCVNNSRDFARIDSGIALGQRLHVRGTPTVIVNGWRLTSPPAETELSDMVTRVLAGQPPVDAPKRQ